MSLTDIFQTILPRTQNYLVGLEALKIVKNILCESGCGRYKMADKIT